MINNTANKTIRLADGRTLGYAEFGPPDGVPMIFFHGWPSSRLGLRAFRVDEIAPRVGVRLIAPDRPGIGLSTFQPGRKFTDWPKDVCELADQLRLAKFAILSWSAGSPYAAVCARFIPERLTAAGIVSGVSRPWSEPGATDGLETKMLWNLARIHPRLVQLVLKLMIGQLKKARPDQLPANARQAMMSEPDFAFLLRTPDWYMNNMSASLEGVATQTWGTAYEGSLYWKPWGFSLTDIPIPVHTWHGDTDGSAPYPAQGQYFARLLKDCRSTLYPGEGHMTVFYNHIEEILRTLLAGQT